jgi:hypothetical protein
MRRQLIATAAMVALLTSSSPAWAQGETKPSIVVLCGDSPTQVPYTLDTWQQMDAQVRRAACTAEGKGSLTQAQIAAAQQQANLSNPSTMRSRKLAWTGIILAIGGGAMLLPQGDTVHVFGEAYCVNTNSIDYGGCGPSLSLAKVGLIVLGTGVTLAWLGLRDVDVKPMVAPGTKGASATVKWGGKGK